MGIFSLSTRALVQQAIDLMVKGTATQVPLSDDVVFPLGKAAAASGFMGEGDFRATVQNAPYSTLLTFLTWLDGQAVPMPSGIPLSLSPSSLVLTDSVDFVLHAGVPVTSATITAANTTSAFTLAGPTITSISAPNLVTCGGLTAALNAPTTLKSPLLTSVSAPLLTTVNGVLECQTAAAITSLSFPSLTSVTGRLYFDNDALLQTVDLPKLVTVGGAISVSSMPSVTTVNLPELVSATSISAGANTTITSLSFPKLTTLTSFLTVSGNTNMTSISFPLLSSMGGSFDMTGCKVTTLSFPLLATGVTSISCGNATLTTLSMPSLVTVNGAFTCNSAALTTVDLSSFLPTNTKNISFIGASLTAASVNHILARCVASAGYLTGVINLSGGTSAAPTGQGITDKATLITRGHTVTTN
jgi:hypothetical protein